MRRDEAIAILREGRRRLRDDFGVKSLALFGSVARDEAKEDSDVDLLVDFDRPVGIFDLIQLQNHLELLLDRKVDVGTFDGLKPRVRESVMKDRIYVA